MYSPGPAILRPPGGSTVAETAVGNLSESETEARAVEELGALLDHAHFAVPGPDSGADVGRGVINHETLDRPRLSASTVLACLFILFIGARP